MKLVLFLKKQTQNGARILTLFHLHHMNELNRPIHNSLVHMYVANSLEANSFKQYANQKLISKQLIDVSIKNKIKM